MNKISEILKEQYPVKWFNTAINGYPDHNCKVLHLLSDDDEISIVEFKWYVHDGIQEPQWSNGAGEIYQQPKYWAYENQINKPIEVELTNNDNPL